MPTYSYLRTGEIIGKRREICKKDKQPISPIDLESASNFIITGQISLKILKEDVA